MFTPMRSKLFWMLDRFRGSKIRLELEQVRSINEFPCSTSSVAHREGYLGQILQHCLETVPYYKQLGIQELSLKEFPILNKNSIRENESSFLSNKYDKKTLYKASTSGSTGTPFTVLQNKGKRRRNIADTMFFAKKANYSLGSPLYFMRIWNRNVGRDYLKRLLQNVHPIDVTRLDDLRIRQLVERLLKGNQKKCMLAYSSAYEAICDYLDKNDPHYSNPKMKSIISMSETLPEYSKSALIKYFNCPVHSRYSNRENGILAQQIPGFNEDYLLNMASYHFEVLDLHTNDPVREGTLEGLWSLIFLIIRCP